MQELFLPYELAVIAKQKGFDYPCICLYQFYNDTYKLIAIDQHWGNYLSGMCKDYGDNINDEEYLAPMYQQMVMWLFKEHGIWITLEYYNHSEPTDKLPIGFMFYIEEYGHCISGKKENGLFKTYQEAMNKAIEESFKYIDSNV